MTDISLSFWDHLEELRQTIIKSLVVILIGTLTALVFYPQVFNVITSPFQEMHGFHLLPSPQLVILGPAEGLSTIMKMSFWVGLLVTSPLWLYFILQFAAPALDAKQRYIIFPFFLFSLLFLLGGFLFAFHFTIPIANQYLAGLNQSLGFNLWTLSQYLDYTVILLLANALAFEACVILLFLVHYRWISAESMRRNRRGVIVGIFIISAVLTPPDVMTQLLLAIPLTAIYEAAILYASIRGKSISIQKKSGT